MESAGRKKIAFWFRYSAADHAELHPCLPGLVAKLHDTCDVHYFSLRGSREPPEDFRRSCVFHTLPFGVDRRSTFDKALKMLLWYACLPFIALRCRFLGIALVCIDDYLPLGALIARVFFGPRIAVWVADFLHEVYAEQHPVFNPIARLVTAIDMAAWRRCPLVFTLAKSTKTFLVSRGVPGEHIYPVYDPCDTTIYRPVDRQAARKTWGYRDDELVLVHHGVLHPNKGIEPILRALPSVTKSHPEFRFLLVGAGAELQKLKTLATELGLGNVVRFGGWLPTVEEVNEALNAGDIALVSRMGHLSDHFHTTSGLAHGMAAGLPILATRLGGISDIIREGENGALFAPGDMDEFREKLTLLLDNKDLRRQYGALALEQARSLFDIDTVTAAHTAPILAALPPPPSSAQ